MKVHYLLLCSKKYGTHLECQQNVNVRQTATLVLNGVGIGGDLKSCKFSVFFVVNKCTSPSTCFFVKSRRNSATLSMKMRQTM